MKFIFKSNNYFLQNKLNNFFLYRNFKFLNFQKKKYIKIYKSSKFYPIFFRNSNFSNVTNFVNTIMKSGQKNKYFLITFKVFKLFYFFLNKGFFFEKNFDNLYKLSSLFHSYKNFFYINFFLDWFIHLLAPKFDLQCLTVPKKYRKKLKCKFLFKLKYVKDFKKKKKVMKWIYLYNLKFNDYTIVNRLFNSFVFTFFEDKKSFLFSKKLIIYKKMLLRSK